MCTSTKRHFITCIAIVAISFLFIDEMEGGGLNNSTYIEERVEVKTKKNKKTDGKKNLREYFFEYFYEESVE